MSYTLKPQDEEAREERAAAYVTQPISVKRIGFAVGIGSIFILSLAGLPSLHRNARMPASADGRLHDPRIKLGQDLHQAFIDLRDWVDPATEQRPIYPTLAEVQARLLPLPDWDSAVLYADDATPAELHDAGLGDFDLCNAFNLGPKPPTDTGMLIWKLALLDSQQRTIARTAVIVPSLEIEHIILGDGADEHEVLLDKRVPDWPRVAVINRPAPEVPSDG